jgi:hypothetical protein
MAPAARLTQHSIRLVLALVCVAAPAPAFAQEEDSEWVMGTPFAIEVEAGYAAVPVSFEAAEGSGVINVAEDPQVGGAGFVIGARVGFPDLLYEGLGVFATFHYFVADITHAMNVGAALRYGRNIVDFFGLELQAGATFFATLEQVSVAYTEEGNAVPRAAESTPLGFAVEITPGAYFPIGIVRLGARGLIEVMILGSGHDLVDTPVAVGGGIEATFGVHF